RRVDDPGLRHVLLHRARRRPLAGAGRAVEARRMAGQRDRLHAPSRCLGQGLRDRSPAGDHRLGPGASRLGRLHPLHRAGKRRLEEGRATPGFAPARAGQAAAAAPGFALRDMGADPRRVAAPPEEGGMTTVHGVSWSGDCHKLRLLLEQLGRPYRWIEVDLLAGATRSPGYLAKNPNGKVPMLELDDGRILVESNAILYWLAEG